MPLIRIRRPSPAMVVALTALFVALGGSSYAALKIGTKDLKNGSVTSAKIRDGTIGSRDIGRRTRGGLRGAKGDKGDPGRNGAAGAPGTALAFALVNGDGSVDAAHSKGVSNANVSHPRTGVYCFSFGFPVRNVTATSEAAGVTNPLGGAGAANDDRIITARARPDAARAIGPSVLLENCAGTEDGSVVVEDPSADAGADSTYDSGRIDAPFYVVFN